MTAAALALVSACTSQQPAQSLALQHDALPRCDWFASLVQARPCPPPSFIPSSPMALRRTFVTLLVAATLLASGPDMAAAARRSRVLSQLSPTLQQLMDSSVLRPFVSKVRRRRAAEGGPPLLGDGSGAPRRPRQRATRPEPAPLYRPPCPRHRAGAATLLPL